MTARPLSNYYWPEPIRGGGEGQLKDVAAQLVSALRRTGLSAESTSTIDQLLLADERPAD
ncbi:hypothetical protein [Mycolicibacterium phocaicum]|uniref:hypothetical protein n=1 Tax=Mycolicibacterium phocaicum TaxID=319706 RepID=UPI001CFC2640|nr:hypothetical protein [Mycolicibacterium phocaicum]UCZ58817.1 hypothetical protein LHJ73_18820 [Mycolicibacterium phocaicum]